MRSLSVFIILAVSLGVLSALQQFRALALFGINPNLILVGFLLIVFAGARRWMLIGLLLLFLTESFYFAPFWVTEHVVFASLVALVFFGKNALTGNVTFDFFFTLLVTPPVFYLLSILARNVSLFGISFSLYTFSFPLAVFGEMIYNFLLGGILWFSLRRVLRDAVRGR